MTLRATYRLQFTSEFRFLDGAALAPYLAQLGVSHVYASPIFAARAGSTHGYDVVDFNRINPELGTEAQFRAMAATFRKHGLGLIVDFVPNHMGIGGSDNRYWLSVLEWGPDSPHADWFDIDWAARLPGPLDHPQTGKVLVPFLGDHYGVVLAQGGLELRHERDGFAIWAHDTHKLPVCPRDYAHILRRAPALSDLAAAFEAAATAPASDRWWDDLKTRLAGADPQALAPALEHFGGAAGESESWEALDGLIARQFWRASRFTLDGDAINYRRFFTISDLAGIRQEDPAVFAATHKEILRLMHEGVVDGIRIDHIDGLRDPKGYCLRLREAVGRPFPLLVEKILGPGEDLPSDWHTDGTTGYEFANQAVGLLADPAGARSLSRLYPAFSGQRRTPARVVQIAKQEVMAYPMAAELEALTQRLLDLATRDPRTADLGRAPLRAALAQVIIGLDVYRTYADADGISREGRGRIAAAAARARRAAPELGPEVFRFIAGVLTTDHAKDHPEDRDAVIETAMRVQQFSGPVMAKGLEDKALYRYNRLIALNEVGSEPGRFGLSATAFHRLSAARLRRSPDSLLATATHDTKRGEDARARIVAITGHADLWRASVIEWRDILADPQAPIDPNEEYFFYQLLLGAWPADLSADARPDPQALEALRDRVTGAMIKSSREAGLNTRWVYGDPQYEAALEAFVARALHPAAGNAFLRSFREVERRIAPDAAANTLIQTTLKLTVPGVPDIYQGAELWEQSLVDPDNRRPVDFARRAKLLEALAPDRPLCTPDMPTEVAKLSLTAGLLALRRDKPQMFRQGTYRAITADGPAAARFCGFLRGWGGDRLLVAVALHPAQERPGEWEQTRLLLPGGGHGRWRNLVNGQIHTDPAPAELFAGAPVAVLLGA